MVKFFKWFFIFIVLAGLLWAGYNYYYYYKAQRLNRDIYVYLEVVLNNLQGSLDKLEEKNIKGFLNSNYQMVRHSNYLKDQNQKIYSNVFVRTNLMNGSLFSSELSETLLWFNSLNTKLNNFYVLANNIFDNNNSFSDVGHLGENMRLIRENILGINNLILSKEGEVIDSIIKNRNLAEDSFSDLKISLQKTHSFFDIVGNVFGEKQKTKTLIFFQNPRNINASGGKWIYYLKMECEKYQCEFSKIDLVSNITLAMIDKLVPPEEIKTQKSVWAFEDMGWFFDFNETGRMALRYFPIKTQFDGIMAVNIDIFENILKKTNSLHLETDEEKIIVNANNVVDFLIEHAVLKNNKETAINLKIINKFWDSFLTEIALLDNNFDTLNTLVFNYLGNKKAQLYYEKNVVKSVNDLNFNNNFKKERFDNYFALVRNNILDQSLDHNIFQQVDLTVEIFEDGRVDNLASILVENKNNTRIRDLMYSYFQIIINKGVKLSKVSFPSKVNVSQGATLDYQRHGFVVDPKVDDIAMRSAYLKDDGARVYEDGNYLVTGGWVLSRSGETKRINISWESLFEIDKKERIYELFVQKQPNIEYLLNLEIIYPSGIEGQKNRIVRSYKIDSDRLIELKIE